MYVGHLALIGFVMIGQVLGWKEIIYARYVKEKEKDLWGFRTLQWLVLCLGCLW